MHRQMRRTFRWALALFVARSMKPIATRPEAKGEVFDAARVQLDAPLTSQPRFVATPRLQNVGGDAAVRCACAALRHGFVLDPAYALLAGRLCEVIASQPQGGCESLSERQLETILQLLKEELRIRRTAHSHSRR
mmetsp:Transcript_14429/g.44222  ORF Transcript_14429/g.44222 Transcript_14429/m.44222 type:complete len:135 (-) Transcript_14429:828-1232(-)